MGHSNVISENLNNDGIDRRGFLKCMAWAGTGAYCVLDGGVLKSFALEDAALRDGARMKSELAFVQISDSHIGFDKGANPDVVGTLRQAIAKINALPIAPAFVVHTGDVSQLSRAAQFDTAEQVLKEIRTERIFYVPGEHDVLDDEGLGFRARFAKDTLGDGWYSFDKAGVHFIGLVNVMNLQAGGLGHLGRDQIEWLERDVRHLSSSTPVVVVGHIPLWSVYPDWGWATGDSTQALSHLKRFGSVTVLNGHIHQTLRKVEGNITFHTAMSTAFPQAAPGQGHPGPLKVAAGQLSSVLGVTEVNFVRGSHALSVTDSSIAQAG